MSSSTGQACAYASAIKVGTHRGLAVEIYIVVSHGLRPGRNTMVLIHVRRAQSHNLGYSDTIAALSS